MMLRSINADAAEQASCRVGRRGFQNSRASVQPLGMAGFMGIKNAKLKNKNVAPVRPFCIFNF